MSIDHLEAAGWVADGIGGAEGSVTMRPRDAVAVFKLPDCSEERFTYDQLIAEGERLRARALAEGAGRAQWPAVSFGPAGVVAERAKRIGGWCGSIPAPSGTVREAVRGRQGVEGVGPPLLGAGVFHMDTSLASSQAVANCGSCARRRYAVDRAIPAAAHAAPTEWPVA